MCSPAASGLSRGRAGAGEIDEEVRPRTAPRVPLAKSVCYKTSPLLSWPCTQADWIAVNWIAAHQDLFKFKCRVKESNLHHRGF